MLNKGQIQNLHSAMIFGIYKQTNLMGIFTKCIFVNNSSQRPVTITLPQ